MRLRVSQARFRMDTRMLCAAIDEDISRGYVPFLISATAGTTAMGTVDPLEVCMDRYFLWFEHPHQLFVFVVCICRPSVRLHGIVGFGSMLMPHTAVVSTSLKSVDILSVTIYGECACNSEYLSDRSRLGKLS